jgi:heptosyltransferase-2
VTSRRIDPGQIKRVVVRGTNWVGDAVMTVPALRELRRVLPDARITLSTRSWAEGLFTDAEFIDELLIYDRPPRSIGAVVRQTREWHKRGFDLALLLQNAFEAALLASASRVRFRLGYPTDGRRALLTHVVPLPTLGNQPHEVFYYLNLVAELERLIRGASDIPDRQPDMALTVSDLRRGQARELLSKRGVDLGRPIVVFCPGSTNSRAKRWPSEYYAALADRLVTDEQANVVLIGSPDEIDVSRDVAMRMNQRPIILTGETELRAAIGVISLADVVITNDTGPAHVAAALDRPTLVIFGPTDPTTTRPFSARAEVIRRPPDCAPCMLRDCPIDHRCMTVISPDEIFSRASAMIGGRMAEVSL